MIIAFACDHGGFPFRDVILEHLKKLWHEVIDFWPKTLEPLDDFPDYISWACEVIQSEKATRGVFVCGTGVGVSIWANHYSGIYAVLGYSPETAKIWREHNDANVICFWARTMKIGDVLQSLDVFLATEFLGGKYQRRKEKIHCSC